MSQIDHTHSTKTLKPIVLAALKLVLLLVVNFFALSFVTGVGQGLAFSDAPTVAALSFVGAAVWIAPFNYIYLKKIV